MNAMAETASCGECETRYGSARELLLLTLLLYMLIESSRALAGDAPGSAPIKSDDGSATARSVAPAPLLSFSPLLSSENSLLEVHQYSATEFSPRRRSTLGGQSSATAFNLDSPLETTSVWQHLSDYRSQDRLRLLTLWETRGSSLSLQTNKHGGPSLQWSTPLISRSAAARGVFDRLFAVSWRDGGSPHSAPAHAPTAPVLKSLAAAPAVAP